jgi:hypothetical protein
MLPAGTVMLPAPTCRLPASHSCITITTASVLSAGRCWSSSIRLLWEPSQEEMQEEDGQQGSRGLLELLSCTLELLSCTPQSAAAAASSVVMQPARCACSVMPGAVAAGDMVLAALSVTLPACSAARVMWGCMAQLSKPAPDAMGAGGALLAVALGGSTGVSSTQGWCLMPGGAQKV